MDNGNMEVKMIRQEFIDFIEKEGKAVYSFCHAMTRNRENADELYQEVMLVAVERCKDMEASNNPKSYLINIAVRLYKNYRRKYARRQRIAPVVELTEELSAVLKDNSIDLEEEVMLQEQRRIIKEETLKYGRTEITIDSVFILYGTAFRRRNCDNTSYSLWYSEKQAT